MGDYPGLSGNMQPNHMPPQIWIASPSCGQQDETEGLEKFKIQSTVAGFEYGGRGPQTKECGGL